jgi:hypothetical protein
MRVAKIFGRGVLALAIAATPLVLSQGTASADPTDTQTASITFSDFSSPPQDVTCSISANASVHPDRASLNAEVEVTGPYDPRCAAALKVAVSYEGDDGVEHTAVANGSGYKTSIAVDHVAGEVHVDNRATFFSCNMPQGGCTLNVQTNPK